MQQPVPLSTHAVSDSLPRPAIRALASSRIREVANATMGDTSVLPFWFGEPDLVTPQPIRDAAIRALSEGDTFYHQNLGISLLRESIASYVGGLHGSIAADRVAVTSSGVHALMLVHQALIDPGARVVIVTPVWPNLTEAPRILGANVVPVPLSYGPAGWTLDVDRLLAALTPNTRALVINSPNNPTGWMIDAGTQRIILAHCRRSGIWIVADDVYERVCYETSVAPSFLAIADSGDRVISTNSFSKSWMMTGWRLGWIVGPAPLIAELPKLVEYNTSCAPGFVQQAGIEAIRRTAEIVPPMQARMLDARDHLFGLLSAMPEIEVTLPPGAMYLFLKVRGVHDSLALAKHLVRHAKIGLAPGIAFGPESEGFLRWCFAASAERLSEGVVRLQRGLAAMQSIE
ncbi:MAG: aminotransferase class I/II-fold pyridoxal phosphate-dependent enzyme [Betaproteobacteria bacterium]|nr:aminotransferase class I/II-fold pyridoxal phosphate-dependent enzyme [Betaproteobacteria bacterium]